MLKHKIFLTIWLLLFVASTYFCLKFAFASHKANNSFRTMKDAVLCDMHVDFSRSGVYTADLRHTSKLSPHGINLLTELHNDGGRELAHILEESETYVIVSDGKEELFSERLFAVYNMASQEQPKYKDHEYTAFFRLPIHPMPKTYTIKFDVTKPCQEADANYSIIARYHFCGLEQMFVHITMMLSCVTGFIAIVLLSCALWRVHLMKSLSMASSGTKTMYLLSAYPKWSETFIRNDIRHLIENGVHLDVVSLFPGNCKREEDWPEATVISSTPEITPNEPSAYPRLIALISKLRRIPCPRWIRLYISFFKHRKLIKEIAAECKRRNIGHIHAEFADLAALVGAIAAEKTGCSFSIGIHALDIHKLKYPAHALLDNAKFITVCNQKAAITISEACPWAKQKLHVIHHGINLNDWPYSEKRYSDDTIRIVFCGRLVPKKGIPILIDAIEILINHSHNQATLEIIGDGPLEEQLKTQVKSLELDNFITFTGRLTQTEIREHFSKASCLCAPSIVTNDGDMDGVPNVILEAMATGLPVIGSTAGSLPEVITNETAWPVQEVTQHTLADAILDMASQPQETDRRRQNARSHVEYRFDAEKLGKKRAALF